MVFLVTLGQQYNVGEKPTVILCTDINRHAGAPNKTKTKDTMSPDYSSVVTSTLSTAEKILPGMLTE